ncbi:MAG: MBL fold metallo-hydrolase [Acidobacteriota bacterium]|nr:MBL fold metallo-hydrolase [Acidobacteriota bacterium]
MRVRVLGSAAGGGFPQWNCACSNCQRFRAGKFHGRARSQTQLAFTTNSKVWFLLSASPDLRTQITQTLELCPGPTVRGASLESVESPLGGVFLPSADVDSVAGLLHLREFQSFFVFATPSVQRILQKENRIFRVLERADPPVKWVALSNKGRLGCHLDEDSGSAPEFLCSTVPLAGAYPDYVSEELQRSLVPEESTSAFVIHQSDKRLFYAPSIPATGAAANSTGWKSHVETSGVSFLDGTFWSDDELIRTGRSKKTARQIGHVPLSGPDGLLEKYPKTATGRRILIHINNTNPILDEDSPQHRAVLDAGFEIAYDGMELEL